VKTKASMESYSHQNIASMFIALGIVVFLSGLIINPWAGKLYRGNMINHYDVMLSYFIWAIVSSILIFGTSLIFRSVRSKRIENITVLFMTCMLIALSDRLLLAKLGLPLWVADVENHYRHRPNTIRLWGSYYNNKLIRINKYGHHDNDFPLKKGDNEFRGLIIGDSITMGHGVTYEETFSNQLENILREKNGYRRSYQIINAGVQGYSTFQEYNLLMESLVFKPDFIAIGFCMNDLTEPFVVDKRFGGVGSDYHGITQVSSLFVSYILNETGYGRLIQKFQSLNKSVEMEGRFEAYSIKKVAQSSVDDPKFSENWKSVLFYLDKIYDTARNQDTKIVLLIFPHTFQLMNDGLQEPQRILINHAKSKNIDVIDFTNVFEKLIFNEGIVKLPAENGFSSDEIHGLYQERISTYFLDEDHYTVEGHRIVASQLYTYLSSYYSFER